jgi:hypothetical protein
MRLICAQLALAALTLASCASPGRSYYATTSQRLAAQAAQERGLAQEHRAAASELGARGDSVGAEISTNAANQADAAARQEQLESNKDNWLSHWWPRY